VEAEAEGLPAAPRGLPGAGVRRLVEAAELGVELRPVRRRLRRCVGDELRVEAGAQRANRRDVRVAPQRPRAQREVHLRPGPQRVQRRRVQVELGVRQLVERPLDERPGGGGIPAPERQLGRRRGRAGDPLPAARPRGVGAREPDRALGRLRVAPVGRQRRLGLVQHRRRRAGRREPQRGLRTLRGLVEAPELDQPPRRVAGQQGADAPLGADAARHAGALQRERDRRVDAPGLVERFRRVHVRAQ